jgi:cell shape-determining protein MreC
MPDDDMPPLPPIATLPARQPEPSVQDEDKVIFGRAAVMLEQLKRDREDALRCEQELQVQLTEAVLARQSDVKKIEFLELENAELRNNIQTLQSDVENYRSFMSNVKKILDAFGVKAPEKKLRKAKSSVTIEAVTPSSTRD